MINTQHLTTQVQGLRVVFVIIGTFENDYVGEMFHLEGLVEKPINLNPSSENNILYGIVCSNTFIAF